MPGHVPRPGHPPQIVTEHGAALKTRLTAAAADLHSDLVIRPDIEQIGLMEWEALPRVVELGRRAARDALESGPELLSRLGN